MMTRLMHSDDAIDLSTVQKWAAKNRRGSVSLEDGPISVQLFSFGLLILEIQTKLCPHQAHNTDLQMLDIFANPIIYHFRESKTK